MNNSFEVRKSELKEFKNWSIEGFKLLYRNPIISFFGFLNIAILSFLIYIDASFIVILNFVSIIMPIISYYSLYLNDTSKNIRELKFSEIHKFIPLEYILMVVLISFTFLLVHLFHIFFPFEESKNIIESPKEQNIYNFKIIDYIPLFLIFSIISSFIFSCVSLKHFLKKMPIDFFNFKLSNDFKTYFIYQDQTDKAYDINFFNFFIFGFFVSFPYFLLVFFLNMHDYFFFITASIVFYFIQATVYVAVKDLIGAGKINSKVTNEVNSFNLKPNYQEE